MDTTVLDRPQPGEKPTTTLPDRWNYQTFKEYLLALSRGPEFRIPLEQMPSEIELSVDFHQRLNVMREETQRTGLEQWTNIGYKHDRSGLWLRNEPLTGANGSVQSETIQHGLDRALQGKIPGHLGDVHSHPREFGNRPILKLLDIGSGTFSIGDFYTLVHPGSRSNLMGVVDGDDNLFAIRTANSINTKAKTGDEFTKAWYKANKWKHLSTGTSGELAIPTSINASSMVGINKALSREYGLALYSGKKDQPLKRVYPDVPKPARIDPFAIKR